jgi:hypothetical protein
VVKIYQAHNGVSRNYKSFHIGTPQICFEVLEF